MPIPNKHGVHHANRNASKAMDSIRMKQTRAGSFFVAVWLLTFMGVRMPPD